MMNQGVGAGRPTKMMSPVDAIKSAFGGMTSFDGRASRSQYWWFALFYSIMDMVVDMIAMNVGQPMLSMLTFLLIPAILALSAKRMHDHGKSGWFMLIPFYNLYLFVIDGEEGVNDYGPPPTNEV
jgi:uncharacterized membrane protein YhaH (DUF805 family)